MLTRGMCLTQYVFKPALFNKKDRVRDEGYYRYNLNKKLVAVVYYSPDNGYYLWITGIGLLPNVKRTFYFSSIEIAKQELDNKLKTLDYFIFNKEISKEQFKKLRLLE